MNEQQLQEIKERAEKAMAGPWHTNSKNEILIDNDGRLGKMIRGYDAEFIAHARQDVPALIAEVERLREALSYYADEEHYEPYCIEGEGCDVTEDEGYIARQALAGDEQ